MKKILFFGIFEPNYSRNRVLIKGAERLGKEVYICRVDPSKNRGLKKYFYLIREYQNLKQKKFDLVIVPFPGHTVVFLAWVIFGRHFVFDAFVSLYNSVVEDRKKMSRFSPKAWWYYFLDCYSLRMAPVILVDTEDHRDYISQKFNVPEGKFIVVPVGSDDSVIHPVSVKGGEKFIVHFHGSGIPLQGIKYIEEAARILEKEDDVVFHMYGPKGRDTVNLKYLGRFPYEEMSQILSRASIVLGIFGDTKKAQLVIPNKVYEGWATRKPVLTAKTPALERVATDGEEVVFSNCADPKDIAEKIIFLKDNQVVRDRVAGGGYILFNKKYKPEAVFMNMILNLEKNV